jgi:hypothetical protein
MATPAEPLKPVSHRSRSEPGATYSPWCSSERGTMKRYVAFVVEGLEH